MRQVAILSARGGVGKTTLTTGLAHLAAQEGQVVLVDADVEQAHLELLTSPTRISEHHYQGGSLAVIDPDACIACGVCDEVCRYGAIRPDSEAFTVIDYACEGCGACVYQCPVEAITVEERQQGIWFHSQTRYGDLFHAHLHPGQDNSSHLVTLVKQKAGRWALDHDADWLLLDGPRGLAFPAMAAALGAESLILVIGPGCEAVAELERMLSAVRRVGAQAAVVLNRWPEGDESIRGYCGEHGIAVVGSIPEDGAVGRAVLAGEPVTMGASPAADVIRAIWGQIRRPTGL